MGVREEPDIVCRIHYDVLIVIISVQEAQVLIVLEAHLIKLINWSCSQVEHCISGLLSIKVLGNAACSICYFHV